MENSLPGWTESWHGVWQLCPSEVFASAPDGSESMASASDCGVDLRKSRLGIVAEHAATIKPQATTAITRLMIPPTSAATPPLPQNATLETHQPRTSLGDASLRPMASALNCPKCGAYKVKYALTLFRGRGSADPQKLKNGAWQLAQRTDHPLGPQFCDRVLGIAVVDGDDRNARGPRGGDVGAGIADHHRMAYVRATNGGEALGEPECVEQQQRQPFQLVGADRKPTAGGAKFVEGGFQAWEG